MMQCQILWRQQMETQRTVKLRENKDAKIMRSNGDIYSKCLESGEESSRAHCMNSTKGAVYSRTAKTWSKTTWACSHVASSLISLVSLSSDRCCVQKGCESRTVSGIRCSLKWMFFMFSWKIPHLLMRWLSGKRRFISGLVRGNHN